VIFSSFCCILWMAERENEWVVADIYLGVMTMEVSGERAGNMDSGSVFFRWIIIVGLHDLVYFLFEQLVEWPWRRQRKRWWCALGFQRRGREIVISPPSRAETEPCIGGWWWWWAPSSTSSAISFHNYLFHYTYLNTANPGLLLAPFFSFLFSFFSSSQ
jgi:drug/metabolite transporter (DMT)-like permease